MAPDADRHRFSCPVYAGKKACKATCLATLNPRVARDTHPTRNGKVKASDDSPGAAMTAGREQEASSGNPRVMCCRKSGRAL